MKKAIFVFLICTIFILNSVLVEAQPPEPSVVDSLTGLPISFTEEANYVELNNTMFVLRFFKDTAGYNEILSKNGTFLVYEDNINLQYLGPGDKWKNRGEPINISWVQVNDYWYNVTRTYDDYEGTYYYITYVIKSDSPVKTSIEIHSGQTDEYRIYWYPSGIVLTDWFNETTKLVFGYEWTLDNWIAFDWFDVAESFGNIAVSGVEDHAQGKKANVWFNIGEIQENETVIIDPSIVGTSTTNTAIIWIFQRKSFHAEGRHWVFYCDGSNFGFRSSTDASSWSSFTTVKGSTTNGRWFAIWFDGTYVHYAYTNEATAGTLLYRRGDPNSDGTITWDTEQTAVSGASGVVIQNPYVSVDTSGYPWIGYLRGGASDKYPVVTKSSTNDGTWSTASGFPHNLSSTHATSWIASPIPLTNQKMLVLYVYNAQPLKSKPWDGSSWGTEKTLTEKVRDSAACSAVNQSDDVHFVFHQDTSKKGYYTYYTYSTNSWSTEIVFEDTAWCYPTASIDLNTNNLYVFWTDVPTSHHVFYRIRFDSNSSWSDRVDWITEGDLTATDRINCFYESYGDYIGVTYMNKTASPFNVKYAYLDVSVGELFQRGVTLALTTSWVATRVLDLGRSVTLALTSAWTPTRVQTLGRSITLALVTAWTPTRDQTLARGVTLPLVSSWSADRALTFVRGVTLTLTSSWAGTRVLRFPRGATLTLTTSWAGTRQANYFVAPVLGLVTSWVATWPVPVVGLDFTLFALLLIIPLGVGVASLKLLRLVSMLCGFFLFIYGAWLGANPYLNTSYYFDSGTETWIINVDTIPMTPWPQVIICLCGIMLIAATMGAILRE